MDTTVTTNSLSASAVGEGIIARNAGWTFGADTPKHFDGHVSKSVPHYNEGHDLILEISDFFVKANSVCYELGSSTGTLSRKLARRHPSSTRWIGIDLEANMVSQAVENLKSETAPIPNLSFVADDINLHPYEPSDLMVSYYTIQFVPPRLRQDLLSHIYRSLNWGGAFLMFEKVRAPDARFQDLTSSLYTDYKLRQGYRSEEIIGKSRSLKGVLEPFSTQGNLDLLSRAGFRDVMTVFKYVCFEGFLCIK